MKHTFKLASALLILILTTAAAEESRGSIKVERMSSMREWVDLVKITAKEALIIANEKVSGKVVELELEVEDRILIYEVSIIDESYRLVELEIDAGTGKILEQELED